MREESRWDEPSEPAEPPDFEFAGFEMPRYTIVPDAVFDYLLPRLGEAELKVLLYITRRTFGFQKNGDNVAISQMVRGIVTRQGKVLDEGTGLSKKSVLKALRVLKRNRIVLAERREDERRGHVETHYWLNVQGGPVTFTRRPSAPEPLGNDLLQDESASPRLGEAATPRLGEGSGPYKRQSQETGGETDLSTGRKPDPGEDPADRATILDFIGDFAREFGDRAKLRGSTTRAMRLYRASGLSLEAFIGCLYTARNATKERQPVIRGSKMAYFFRLLEEDVREAASS